MNEQDMQRVRSLISELYSPSSSPQTVKDAQEQLLVAQKSQFGWELANALLKEPEPNAQFLGAVTFAIKLNDEKFTLENARRDEILGWLGYSVRNKYRQFVTRKLLNDVTILFFRTYSDWTSFLNDVLGVLDGHRELILSFFVELIEEYNRSFTGIPTLRSTMEKMIPVIGSFVESCFGHEDLVVEALNTFLAWGTPFPQQFFPLLPQIIEMLRTASSDYDVFDKASSVLADFYATHYYSIPRKEKEHLHRTLLDVTQPFDWDTSVCLGRLVLVFCEHEKDKTNDLIPYILQLTENPVPVSQDELCNEVLDFWDTAVEDAVSEGMSTERNALFQQVINIYWYRIQLPTDGNYDWDELRSFRRDFCDFLELAYPILGRSLFENFAGNILENLERSQPNWLEIEVSLCCLNSLADSIDDSGEEYKAIESVFSSSLWSRLNDCPVMRIRDTAVHVIGSYSKFFESDIGRANLPRALTYLFQSLTEPNLQNIASRSVLKLCSSCRSQLGVECENFLKVYEPIRFNLSSIAHCRTVSAITCVIESLPMREQPVPLSRLLILVNTANLDPLDLLKCVASIGKSMQTLEETFDSNLQRQAQEFWSSDPENIRANLMALVSKYLDSPDVEIFEQLCCIIKSGLRETLANPFTFGPAATLQFLSAKRSQNQSDTLPPLVGLACFFVATRLAAHDLEPATVSQVLRLLAPVDAPDKSLELLRILVANKPDLFLAQDNVVELVDFALQSLSTSNKFVLIEASRFWVAFVSQPQLSATLSEVGLPLMQKIAEQISGEAQRSEVPLYADIICKLMKSQPLITGKLLEEVFIVHPNASLQSQSQKSRADLVQQIVLLRGGRQTARVINKFWLVCKGLPEY